MLQDLSICSEEHLVHTSSSSIRRRIFARNCTGVSYDALFGAVLDGSSEISITEPYTDRDFKIQNCDEFILMLVERKTPDQKIRVNLMTRRADQEFAPRQEDLLKKMAGAWKETRVTLDWEFSPDSESTHDRHIVTDTGQVIDLSRGLDIWQYCPRFGIAARYQVYRRTRDFTINYSTVEECREIASEELVSC